jgi:hypothetical protein
MARKCRKNDKNPPLRCLLKGFASGAGELGGIFAKSVAGRAQKIKKEQKKKAQKVVKVVAKSKKLPPKTQMISNSLVGNVKAGHGGLCHMNKIKKMKGPKHGGEGLKRVGKQLG